MKKIVVFSCVILGLLSLFFVKGVDEKQLKTAYIPDTDPNVTSIYTSIEQTNLLI